MGIHVVFTRNNTLASRLIRWITGEPCSHCGIVFADKVLIHSNFLGLHLEWLEHTLQTNTVVASVHIPSPPPAMLSRLSHVLTRCEDFQYDFYALFCLGSRLLLRKLFRLRFKPISRPLNRNLFTCTEFVTKIVYGTSDSNITPFALFQELQEWTL